MKFESIKSNDLFGAFQAEKVDNLNAILGGYKTQTDNNVASKADGKNGDDCKDTETGEVTDDGHCEASFGGDLLSFS